jgi:hypothetical protein
MEVFMDDRITNPAPKKPATDSEKFQDALSKDIQDGNPVVSSTGNYGKPKTDFRPEYIPEDRTGAPVPVDGGKGDHPLTMH